MIWALGLWRDLGSGFAGEVEDWFVGSWRKVSGSPAKSKLMGRWRWALSSSSLSLSLFARGRDLTLTLTLSLSVFRKMIFEGKIKMEIILHPTHGQTKKHFWKMYFPCATKHPHLRKSISGNHFHPKQTQPMSQTLARRGAHTHNKLHICATCKQNKFCF